MIDSSFHFEILTQDKARQIKGDTWMVANVQRDHDRKIQWLSDQRADILIYNMVVHPTTFEPIYSKVIFFDPTQYAMFSIAWPDCVCMIPPNANTYWDFVPCQITKRC